MRMDEMPLDSTITRADVENSLDGNGVDLDKEVARSAENSVRYSASSEMTRRKIAILNYAISSVR
jgi:flagellar basal-body rod protein FlgB